MTRDGDFQCQMTWQAADNGAVRRLGRRTGAYCCRFVSVMRQPTEFEMCLLIPDPPCARKRLDRTVNVLVNKMAAVEAGVQCHSRGAAVPVTFSDSFLLANRLIFCAVISTVTRNYWYWFWRAAIYRQLLRHRMPTSKIKHKITELIKF